jgi:hypothetical protein
VKIYFPNSKIIRISIESSTKFKDFLEKYIKCNSTLLYLDDENEWITIETEEDWKMCLITSLTYMKGKTLKIKSNPSIATQSLPNSSIESYKFEESVAKHLNEPISPLLKISGVQMANLLKLKRISCLQLIEEHISHIKRINPKINAMVNDRFEEAIKEAKKSDETIATSNVDELFKKFPYFGVPCTIKENFKLIGMRNTSGLVSRKEIEIAKEDATVVQLMKKAGFIVLGNTNVSEICMWMEAQNEVFGRTNNPYDLTRTAGGSSGGEGSIIGSGCSPLGIGSDIGGSIRIPAYFNVIH